MAPTKSEQDIAERVDRLRQEFADVSDSPAHHAELKDLLERTLHDLFVHQEELRAQNAEMVATRERVETLLNRYSTLFEHSPVALLSIDSRLSIVEFNDAVVQLFRIRRPFLAGKPVSVFVDTADAPRLNAHFARVFAGSRASDEVVIRPRKGRRISCLLESRPIRDPDSGEPLSLTIAFDTTRLKESERQIAVLSERNQRILDTAGDGIFGVDVRGKVMFANPAAGHLLGWGVEGLLNRAHHGLFHHSAPDGRPLAPRANPVHRSLRDAETRRVHDQVFWRCDGTAFPVEYVVAPMIEEDRVTGAVVTFRDVTRQRQADAALRTAKEDAERANRTKSTFLANMSHELRTPLNAIIGFSDAIRTNALGFTCEGPCAEYLTHIHDSGQVLLELINDILDVSAIEAGRVELIESAVDLDAVAEAAFRMVRGRAEGGGVILTRRLPGELPRLWADERRIKQILVNLLSNAVKFTGAGGSVTLDAERDRSGLVVRVVDTGVGIREDEIPHILEPFGQASNALLASQSGTGLGLPIVKSLMDLHGGSLELSSRLGEGTIAALCFPPARVLTGNDT